MSVIDEVLVANEIYSRTHELRKLTPRPERKLAVLTCMDTRLSIRTAGIEDRGCAYYSQRRRNCTSDTLRSLVISHHLLGPRKSMVINHTDCGLMQTNEEDLRNRIQTGQGRRRWLLRFFMRFRILRRMCGTSCRSSGRILGFRRRWWLEDLFTM